MRRNLRRPRRVGARRHLLRAGLAEQAGARHRTLRAGGPVDIIARIVGAKLNRAWASSSSSKTAPGRAGNIGAAAASKSGSTATPCS